MCWVIVLEDIHQSIRGDHQIGCHYTINIEQCRDAKTRRGPIILVIICNSFAFPYPTGHFLQATTTTTYEDAIADAEEPKNQLVTEQFS